MCANQFICSVSSFSYDSHDVLVMEEEPAKEEYFFMWC
jgi:hypothetical protein